MKTKILPLIIVLALAGCNQTGTSQESKEVSNSVSSIVSSETTTASSSKEENTSSDASSSSTISSNPPDPVGVQHKIVNFYNGGFTNSSLDKEASQKQFVDWFNGEDDILESIDYSGYAQLNYIGNEKDSWRFSTLILGSNNSDGGIRFNLKYDALSIKVVVQPYTKYIAYSDSYNVDTNATFIIDGNEYDLSLEDGYHGETETTTIEYSFGIEGSANEYVSPFFRIANKEAGQRVFVHSLEITYWN